MDRRHALSVVGLFLAAALVLGLARLDGGWLQGRAEDRLPRPEAGQGMSAGDTRRTLRTYFSDHYSEASCSAIYTDLTHDGLEELLVLAVETGRTGEPVSLHGGTLDADHFTRASVSVLQAGEGGAVFPIYAFACGAEHRQWGELYLKKEEGLDYLLWYAPYTGAGRSDFQIALFSLGQDGTALDRFRERIFFPAEGGEAREGDADEAAISSFLERAEALLEDAQPVIAYNTVHDPFTGSDGPRRFAYLDTLFGTY